MTKLGALTLGLVLFAAVSARANDERFLGLENFYMDGGASAGYSSVTTGSPRLVQTSVGVTAGEWLIPARFFVGLTSDFRFVNQYSAMGAEGNMRGTRWNVVSPTLGYKNFGVLLKLDLQFVGNYNLSNSTILSTATPASFRAPMGARLVALYPLRGKIHVGTTIEYMTFGKINGVNLRDGKLKQWQTGLSAAYLF